MSALPPKADILRVVVKCPLMTQSGHSAGGGMAANENYIIEGAAGVALAAGLKDASNYRSRKISVVVCGRNIALDTFRSVIEQGE